MSDENKLRQITRWVGFFSSLLVFVLGVVHLALNGAKLYWPDGKFNDDVNKADWRSTFTFVPDVFADLWTPTVLGLFGLLWHYRKTVNKKIMSSFGPYFVFMFLTAMFGCIGYNGGLGILFSIPVFATCLLSIITFFVEDGPVSLYLNHKLQSGSSSSSN